MNKQKRIILGTLLYSRRMRRFVLCDDSRTTARLLKNNNGKVVCCTAPLRSRKNLQRQTRPKYNHHENPTSEELRLSEGTSQLHPRTNLPGSWFIIGFGSGLEPFLSWTPRLVCCEIAMWRSCSNNGLIQRELGFQHMETGPPKVVLDEESAVTASKSHPRRRRRAPRRGGPCQNPQIL